MDRHNETCRLNKNIIRDRFGKSDRSDMSRSETDKFALQNRLDRSGI